MHLVLALAASTIDASATIATEASKSRVRLLIAVYFLVRMCIGGQRKERGEIPITCSRQTDIFVTRLTLSLNSFISTRRRDIAPPFIYRARHPINAQNISSDTSIGRLRSSNELRDSAIVFKRSFVFRVKLDQLTRLGFLIKKYVQRVNLFISLCKRETNLSRVSVETLKMFYT